MSNSNKYLAFVKTVEYGSFSKAAEILNYSQSGISRMIKDLEDEWGVTLLKRSSAGMQLTSEGAQLLPFAREACAQEQKLQDKVLELKGMESGLIRIATFSSVATHWLPYIIKEFNKDYPEIEYELILGDYKEIEEWLITGRADCGFLRLPTRPELETEFLDSDRLMVALPEDHPLADCEKFPIKALEDYPFMLLENDVSSDVTDVLYEWGIKPHVQFTTWEDYSILAMIEQGLGIGILPELVLKRIPYSVVIKDLDTPAYRSIAFAVKDKNTVSNAVLRFMDYLKFRPMP